MANQTKYVTKDHLSDEKYIAFCQIIYVLIHYIQMHLCIQFEVTNTTISCLININVKKERIQLSNEE